MSVGSSNSSSENNNNVGSDQSANDTKLSKCKCFKESMASMIRRISEFIEALLQTENPKNP
ncbi:hypothetical protein JR316_0012501 [Psilocybe cubensis]|uniref:Uncharacterized protein n=1 Tax=Psilocybe cubensis TaxID=181762 RepID=A0ACB8GI51_PSICU|nr:hypothetical protein JR316_0012501 [Psilocybe cubensis]KAH9475390.1 hypothetical protein JR316_0012501 [Psilocybe cubensis]